MVIIWTDIDGFIGKKGKRGIHADYGTVMVDEDGWVTAVSKPHANPAEAAMFMWEIECLLVDGFKGDPNIFTGSDGEVIIEGWED